MCAIRNIKWWLPCLTVYSQVHYSLQNTISTALEGRVHIVWSSHYCQNNHWSLRNCCDYINVDEVILWLCDEFVSWARQLSPSSCFHPLSFLAWPVGSNLSCMWVIDWNRVSSSLFSLDEATKEQPAAGSALSKSMTALVKVWPWLLWMPGIACLLLT